MTYRLIPVLARHFYRIWRAGQLRFRLETFGVYYPALPYTLPWWSARPANLILFLRQFAAYARWIMEMDEMGHAGAQGWWRSQKKDLRCEP